MFEKPSHRLYRTLVSCLLWVWAVKHAVFSIQLDSDARSCRRSDNAARWPEFA